MRLWSLFKVLYVCGRILISAIILYNTDIWTRFIWNKNDRSAVICKIHEIEQRDGKSDDQETRTGYSTEGRRNLKRKDTPARNLAYLWEARGSISFCDRVNSSAIRAARSLPPSLSLSISLAPRPLHIDRRCNPLCALCKYKRAADITDCRHRRDSRIGCASLLHSPFDSSGTFPPSRQIECHDSISLSRPRFMHFDEGGERKRERERERKAGIETRVLGSRERRERERERERDRVNVHVCVCITRIYDCVWAYGRARVGFVVSLVFCDDDVFSVFRGMPRAALIVTELGPRATLVRMRAVALAFSVSPPLSPPPPPLLRARR